MARICAQQICIKCIVFYKSLVLRRAYKSKGTAREYQQPNGSHDLVQPFMTVPSRELSDFVFEFLFIHKRPGKWLPTTSVAFFIIFHEFCVEDFLLRTK